MKNVIEVGFESQTIREELTRRRIATVASRKEQRYLKAQTLCYRMRRAHPIYRFEMDITRRLGKAERRYPTSW